jgi:hypothetical protein
LGIGIKKLDLERAFCEKVVELEANYVFHELSK